MPTSGQLVQAVLTATARLDRNSKITSVRVSGRPKGRFKGGAQGSHVTAFGIFRDVLESATLGRTVDDAYTNVEALVDDLTKLPGYVQFKKKLPADRPEPFDPDDVEVYELQELMAYYLEARDAAGYSAAFLGEGMAMGKGEGTILRRLRELENQGDLDDMEISDAKELIDGLYDTDAVDELARLVRKRKALAKARRRWARSQHLMTVSQAFPKVYAALHGDDSTAYPSFSRLISQAKAVRGFDRATGRDLFLNLGVMAVPKKKGGYDLTISGRPSGPFSQSSTMGSHTIAFSLVVEAIKRQMSTARSAVTVRRRLLNLLMTADYSSLDLFRANLSRNAKGRYDEAKTILQSATRRIRNLEPEALDASDVEAAVEALILHHNVSPLSAVLLGGPANNKGEQVALSQLRGNEKGDYGNLATTRSEMVHNVYRLLDGATIERLVANRRKHQNLPGASGHWAAEVAAILDTFFDHVEKAFPSLYEKALPHHEKNIVHYLTKRLGLAIDADEVLTEMVADVAKGRLARGSSLADRDRRVAKKRTKRRRRSDEEDFVFTGKSERPRNLRRGKRRRKAPTRFY